MRFRPSAGAAAICAISWWPALNFCAANWQSIRHNSIASLTGVLALSLLISSSGYALYRWRGRAIDVVAFWVSSVCLFFGYLAVRNAALDFFSATPLWKWPPSIAWFGLSALVFSVVWYARRSATLQRAALTFAFVAPVLALLMLFGQWLRAPHSAERETAGTAPLPVPEAHGKLDVFYIILDAYAGARSLERDFGFDNSPFLERMAMQQFRDLSTERSNYLQTAQTLGSIMRLDYAETDDPATWRNPEFLYPSLLDYSRPPPLIERLQAAGYATWFSGSLLSGCPARHMHCAGKASAGPVEYTTQAFLASTPLGRPLMQHLFNKRRNALEPLDSILRSLRGASQPAFVFAHHLSPHPPFMLDRNCEPRIDDQSDWEVWASSPEAYIEAVRCVNRQVGQLVDTIIAADPTAIIVLEGDHGAAFDMKWEAPMASWSVESVRERASYLNLVRAPARCQPWLGKPLGQVNTARFVLACVEGRAPDYLPERTWMSTYHEGAESGVVRLWSPPADEVLR